MSFSGKCFVSTKRMIPMEEVFSELRVMHQIFSLNVSNSKYFSFVKSKCELISAKDLIVVKNQC